MANCECHNQMVSHFYHHRKMNPLALPVSETQPSSEPSKTIPTIMAHKPHLIGAMLDLWL